MPSATLGDSAQRRLHRARIAAQNKRANIDGYAAARKQWLGVNGQT
jgi:uncharacterized Zn-binding protein involved in type VI secretion